MARARRSVVRVIADRGFSIGSGSIIKVEGDEAYILTAYHVLQEDINKDVLQVQVELFTEDVLEARISRYRIDAANDLAILTVRNLPSPPPPAIPWESAVAIRETQRVYALGHLQGGPGWAVTDGTVSRIVGGKIYFSGTTVDSGNSGGPLLNTEGAFVGINVSKGGGLGTALMADVIRPIIRGWVPAWPEVTPERRQQTSQPSSAPQSEQTQQPAHVIRGKDGKEMRLVSAGWFEMGSTDAEIEAAYQLVKKFYKDALKSWFEAEKPRHRVWVDAFYMDTYEVTVQEYQAFRRATGHRELPAGLSKYAPGEQHPIVGVSWDDAEAYCRWADKALPTEAQWEKAARGTDGRTYPWGNEPATGRRANYCDAQCEELWKDTSQDDGYRYTAPVGSFAAGTSPYGIHDLAGNVWEWVRDWYDPQYYSRSPERNPENTTAAEFRVLRGGGWSYRATCVRAALRFRLAPADLFDSFGFRCVVEVSVPRK